MCSGRFGSRSQFVKALVWILVCLAAFAPLIAAADYCEMARDVAARAAAEYGKNQEQGIKLFIKAKNLCDRPLYAYNLGLAYFQ